MEFFRRTDGGGIAPIKRLPAKASEVIVKGKPVNLESGLLCAGAKADTTFVGIANMSLTPAADGELVEVVLGLESVEFKAPFVTSGTKKTLVNADIGTAFDLLTADLGKIDLDDTTGGAWIVTGFNNTRLFAIVTLDREKAANIVGGHVDAIE